jgi:hypothetical protein
MLSVVLQLLLVLLLVILLLLLWALPATAGGTIICYCWIEAVVLTAV